MWFLSIEIPCIFGWFPSHRVHREGFSRSVRFLRPQSWVPFNPWCCVTSVPIQNFSFPKRRASISNFVKRSVLFIASTIMKSMLLKFSSFFNEMFYYLAQTKKDLRFKIGAFIKINKKGMLL